MPSTLCEPSLTSTSVLDFESRSACDLKLAGAWAYAAHWSTEILCLSFEYGSRVRTWAPPGGLGASMTLQCLIADPDVLFVSHGDFERAIWHEIMVPHYGFQPLPNEKWHDTMAAAAQKQLPLDLDTLARVLKLPEQKDREGSRFTKLMSKLGPDGNYDNSPASLQRVYTYCEQDIATERAVLNKVGWLQPSERPVWLLDQTINQRGIRIDLDYVRSCQKIVDEATEPLAKEFTALTGGTTFTQVAKIRGWLLEQGVHLPDLKKETVAEVLGHDVDGDGDGDVDDHGPGSGTLLPSGARRALEIRQLVGSAAIKKLPRMAACVSPDGRARGLLQYHRAGPGRWAGRIVQPQNFPRPSLKDDDGNLLHVDTIVSALQTGDWRWVEMMLGSGAVEAVVTGLRHALIAAPGHEYLSGDYMQIEARIVLALAGQFDKVALFLTGTPYVDMAQSIYKRPISKKNDIAEYTIGKNTVLGCGFQMGAPKFFARYCPKQSMEFAKGVIDNYRQEWAPLVPKLWRALEHAACDTVWSGQPHEAYGVEYRLEEGWLTARIPSGRKLYYWNPQKVVRVMPWRDDEGREVKKAAWTYQAIKQGQWRTIDAFGGLLTENVVQGLARDVLVCAMFKLEANNFPLVLTVHDEALAEPLANADELAYKQIMEDTAPWVKALRVPIGVETWRGDRYRK